MNSTASRVLVILLVITSITGGVLYKQLLDTKDPLKNRMEKIEHLQKQVLVTEEALDKISRQLKEAKNNIELQKKQIQKSKSQQELAINELNKMIAMKDDQYSQSLDIINALEQAGEKKEEQLDAREGIIGNLQDKLASSNQKIYLLEGNLKAEVEKSGELSNQLENEKKNYEYEFNGLNSTVAKLESELTQLKEKYSKDHETIGQLGETNQKDRQSLDAANETILSLEKEIEQKIDQIANLVKELDDADSLRESEARKAEEQISLLEKEMEKKISMTGNEIAELKSQLSEGSTIQKKVTELEKEKGETLIQTQNLKETYDELIEKLKHELENQNATIKEFEKKLTVTFINSILFDFGKATLNKEGQKTVNRIGNVLKNYPGGKFSIIGHTDNIPIAEEFHDKFPSNWELSAARASSIARFFQEVNTIDPKRIEVVGKSYYQPLFDNNTKEGRSKNRRVEIVITPDIK